MRYPCFIVVSLTRDKFTKKICEFSILNCFQTETQAIAAIQYEADICEIENGEKATWLTSSKLLLPDGWNPNEETIIFIEDCADFFDKQEPLFRYEEE